MLVTGAETVVILKLSTPAVASAPESSVSFHLIYKYSLLAQLKPVKVWVIEAPPIKKSGEIAAWVPGAPVPEDGVVKPVPFVQLPAPSLNVPSPDEEEVTTLVALFR